MIERAARGAGRRKHVGKRSRLRAAARKQPHRSLDHALTKGFADLLNNVAANGYEKWEVGHAQSVLGKSFAPFGLVADKAFMEYDLVYLSHGMMFWGARNVDGRGFDTEQNRPTNLQIPLVRK